MRKHRVQSDSDPKVLQHERGPPSARRRAGDGPRPSVRNAEGGPREDRIGRRYGLRFRDERRTALVVCTGQSLRTSGLESRPDWPAIGVNDGWRRYGCEALYSGDARWWRYHVGFVRAGFAGRCYSCDRSIAKEHGLNFVEVERAPGLSQKEGVLRAGGLVGNSGAQALNLAYLFGARRILLLGMDMHGSHYFGDHPKGLAVASPFQQFISGMRGMAEELERQGVEVLNCSPISQLPYFPKVSLLHVLPASLHDSGDSSHI